MELIHSPSAPQAIGPYSHAVRSGGFLFCSGQIPLDPATMQIVDGGIEEQTRRVLANIAGVLEAAQAGPANVVKTTIFLTEMTDFPTVNEIYAEFFGDHKPARSTVAVAALPLGSRVEIECIVAPDQ